MTMNTATEAPPDVRRAQRNSRVWGALAIALLFGVCAGMTFLVVDNDQQDTKLTALTGVIDKQNDLYGQVCKLAGGQIGTDPAAREACARVGRGEPAVPIPVVVTVVSGPKKVRDGSGNFAPCRPVATSATPTTASTPATTVTPLILDP